MAPRAFWKGYLKFSLVTCPVEMSPAVTEAERMRFRILDRATAHPIESRHLDAKTGREVGSDEQARGYDLSEGRTIRLEEDEIDAVALESARTIDLETFVERDAIGWIWLDRPHYLAPADKVGEEAYAVIRDALDATGCVGIARVVLYRRERAVMLAPRGPGLMLWTLRYGGEVRPAEPLSGEAEDKPDARALKLLRQVIAARKQDWSPDFVKDPVQERLAEIVAAKSAKGRRKRKKPAGPKVEETTNVVSIMDALKKSLAAEKRGKG